MMTPVIKKFINPDSLSVGVAEYFVDLAKAAVATKDCFCVALAGGRTPKSTYQLLSTPTFVNRIDWPKVKIFWGDERCVSPDDEHSNFRMTNETLLQHVPVLPENIYRMKGELDPGEAALQYEKNLQNAFGLPHDQELAPRFDLILLGLGRDGHTASIFPGTAAVFESDHWVLAHFIPALQAWRLTLTPVILNAAQNAIFLVSGMDKAEITYSVLKGDYQPETLPSQIVQPENGNLFWFVDKDAACKL
jgi:6-phosphogluconolactonase